MNRAYYKYNFVPVEPLWAKIVEELRSYFSTGALDEIMFPSWTDTCLRHLGKASLAIVPTIIEIDDYVGKLPENFISAREVWACAPVKEVKYKEPSSTYTELNTRISSDADRCQDDCEFPEVITVVYKTNREQRYTYSKQWLLRPGNIDTRKYCSDDCFNIGSTCPDTFDIHGNKIVTSFRTGHVYLLFYSSSEDECGNQLIPDNYRIEQYIEAYIKYKLFEQLSNQSTDETYNQMERKKADYREQSDTAAVSAKNEIKLQTTDQKFSSINKTKRRNLQYIIR